MHLGLSSYLLLRNSTRKKTDPLFLYYLLDPRAINNNPRRHPFFLTVKGFFQVTNRLLFENWINPPTLFSVPAERVRLQTGEKGLKGFPEQLFLGFKKNIHGIPKSGIPGRSREIAPADLINSHYHQG